MSNIRDTALEAFGGRLPRGTGTRAQAALDALEAREQAIFRDLVDAAVDAGMSADKAALALANAGLTAPTEEPAADDSVEARIGRLEEMAEKVMAYAKRKGLRV